MTGSTKTGSIVRFGIALVVVLALVVSAAYANPTGVADGTYEGSAEGYKSQIVVQVTVSGGAITAIEVVSHDETVRLAEPVMERTIEDIISAQSSEVDARTRATASSKGLIEAVRNALASAN